MTDPLSTYAILQRGKELIPAIEKFIEWHGLIHDDGCPEDDTCDCTGKTMNDAANDAYCLLPLLIERCEAIAAERDALKTDRDQASRTCADMMTAALTLQAQVAALTAENARLTEENEKLADDVDLLSNSEALKGIAEGLDDIKHGRVISLASPEQWEPIAEAPKDGTLVIVALIRDGVRRVSDARFQEIGWYARNGDSCHWATHWIGMALSTALLPPSAERETPEQPS